MNVEEHGSTIMVDDIARDLIHAECRCGGWVGETVPAEQEHVALAGWAAHVHVANGLAVES